MTPTRYLVSSQVTIPSKAPLFVEKGHCQWCNKPFPLECLAKRLGIGTASVSHWLQTCGMPHEVQRLIAPETERHTVPDWNASVCAVEFLSWWCSRPAYVRATFIRDNFTCCECGLHPIREDKPWLPDISQLARGGVTEMSNLQTLCQKCNRPKGTSGETIPV